MSEVETFVRLKYFSPFDINKVPETVLLQVHFATFGLAYKHGSPAAAFSLQDTLTLLCDEWELERGCRKALIEYYSK